MTASNKLFEKIKQQKNNKKPENKYDIKSRDPYEIKLNENVDKKAVKEFKSKQVKKASNKLFEKVDQQKKAVESLTPEERTQATAKFFLGQAEGNVEEAKQLAEAEGMPEYTDDIQEAFNKQPSWLTKTFWHFEHETRGIGKALAGAMSRTLGTMSEELKSIDKQSGGALDNFMGMSGLSTIAKSEALTNMFEDTSEVLKQVEQGIGGFQENLYETHPEWRYDPPDSVKGYFENPEKLGTAIVGALPILASAGMLTAAGQPQMSLAFLYATEGQEAYDQAIQSGATEDEAVQASMIYGAVAAGIEQLQITQWGRLAGGIRKGLIGRTAQKTIAEHAGKVSKDIIKNMGNEALEEMMQGAWQEETARITYGGGYSGGFIDYVDRRAQEALIAGALSLAVGGGAGISSIGSHAKTRIAQAIEVDETNAIDTQASAKKRAEQRKQELTSSFESYEPKLETAMGDFSLETVDEVVPKHKHKGFQSEKTFTNQKRTPLKTLKNWAILTAWDPQNKPASKEQNHAQNANMLEDLRSMGYDPIPVGGKFGTSQESFLVPKMAPEDALVMANKYNQDSVATKQGLVYQDGTINPVDTKGKSVIPKEIQHLEWEKGQKKAAAHNLDQSFWDWYNKVGGKKGARKHGIRVTKDANGNWYAHTTKTVSENDAVLGQPDFDISFDQNMDDNYSVINIKGKRIKFRVPYDFSKKEVGNIKASNKQKARHHILAQQLGMGDKTRRNMIKTVSGKTSMKDVTFRDAAIINETLANQVEEAGMQLPEDSGDMVDYLTKSIEANLRIDEDAVIKAGRKLGLLKWARKIKHGLTGYNLGMTRITRLAEMLDGYEHGPMSRFKDRMVEADDAAISEADALKQDLMTYMGEMFGSKDALKDFMTSHNYENIPGVGIPLSHSEKMGIYLNSQNKNQLGHLIDVEYEINGEKHTFTAEEIEAVNNNLTQEEKQVADFILQKYNEQFPEMQNAYGIATGKELDFEEGYAPILTEYGETVETKDNYLDLLSDEFNPDFTSPEAGMTKERVGGKQAIKLNPYETFFKNSDRIARYKNFAPISRDINRVLNNKKWKKAVNKATDNHGTRIMKRWAANTIRGYDNTPTNKVFNFMRKNSVVFSIGMNITSAMRAGLSLHTGIAEIAGEFGDYGAPLAVAQQAMNAYGGKYKDMRSFINQKSNMMKNRRFDRYQNARDRAKGAERRIAQKFDPSKFIMGAYEFIDNRTTSTIWMTAYETALNNNYSEKEAIRSADRIVSKTQPMGRVRDLPHFYQGSELHKMLTVFQNMTNQNYNLWMHDTVGKYKAGKISGAMAAYKTLWSYVVPAMAFGLIGRGEEQENWKEVSKDLIEYPMASLFFVGRMGTAVWNDYGMEGIYLSSVKEAKYAIQSKKASTKAEHAAKAIGAFTGKFPRQLSRTMDGAIRIFKDETDDWRELVWSKYVLRQNKEDEKRQVEQRDSTQSFH